MSSPSVFAFLAFTSGSYEGAIIRDMRLANELHRRGFKVVVYWYMENNRDLLSPQIPQRILVGSLRYLRPKPSTFSELLEYPVKIIPPARRRRFMQQHPAMVARGLTSFVNSMCDGSDPVPAQRLEKFMAMDGVTHLFPTFVMTCPIALAAKRRGHHPFDYVATFQGEEIFANYAQLSGNLEKYHAVLRECVAGTPWKTIVVSDDYGHRLAEEMNIDPTKLTTIYPGIELPSDAGKPSFEVLREKLPTLDPNVPIVTYFGRQDTEKGIDLLLYATKMLWDRGVKFQLVICGGTSFGWTYQEICRTIAAHLRLSIFWKRRISDEMRSALYAHSRCVVYPAIHREPFGMVAAETMSHGTPVIIPDLGGIAESIEREGHTGGLKFKSWNTQDLAAQIERMVTDNALHAKFASEARFVAAKFSIQNMTDQLLAHIGLPLKPE
jgi:glycosyltransferase involved in cell wall biosynthesis